MLSTQPFTADQFAKALVPLEPALSAFARKYVDIQDVADVLGNMRLIALLKLQTTDSETENRSGLARWLFAILRRECLAWREQQVRRREDNVAPEGLPDLVDYLPACDDPRPEERRHALLSRIRRANLTERQREILWRRLEGETQTQIAYAIGISQPGVNYHFAKALNALAAVDMDEIDPGFLALFNELSKVATYSKPKCNPKWRRSHPADAILGGNRRRRCYV